MVAQGTSVLESVVVENKGLQDAIELQFSLTRADGSPAPAWAAVASSANGTLPIGGKRSVDISFTPPASTSEGVYQLRLKVTGVNVAEQSVPVFASITQSGMGNVLFKAADIYTATLDKNGLTTSGSTECRRRTISFRDPEGRSDMPHLAHVERRRR